MKKILRRLLPPELPNLGKPIHSILHRVYAARGVQSAQEIENELSGLLSFESLLNIEKACTVLEKVLVEQKRILIIGDFDSDGATSTALGVRALRALGAENVDFLVPNRFDYGYGLTPEIVAVAAKKKPDLIITVDNGIANHAGVDKANELGIKVLITDHHLAGDTLPNAETIINPNQPGDLFPSKNLAGVGVIFYVMLALRSHLKALGWFEKKSLPVPNMANFLDLVALGTVADLVPLDHNNRILVHQGLKRICAGQSVVGIQALLAVAGRSQERITASDLGFVVAPRLNAAGRLAEMSLGVACLLDEDFNQARERATQLNALNLERRQIERDMQQQAFSLLREKNFIELKNNTYGLCLFDEKFHQGVIGLLASRLKEQWHRPTIVFAASDEIYLKGSARSIPGLHIRDVLVNLDVKRPGLIERFGGHAMAAGLTLKREHYETFVMEFDSVVREQIDASYLEPVLYTDGELSLEDFSVGFAEILRGAGPWGQNFSEPLFEGMFEILDQRLVGEKHLKLLLNLGGKQLDAILFNADLKQWPNHRARQARAVYRLDVNEYLGLKKVQLIVEWLQVFGE